VTVRLTQHIAREKHRHSTVSVNVRKQDTSSVTIRVPVYYYGIDSHEGK
jgi:hypothetical protein